MTRSEYQELVEFLGPKFDALNRRFEAIDHRFDAIDHRFDAIDRRFDALEDRLTRVEVLCEDNRHQIEIVAEGVGAVWSELGRLRTEMTEGFGAVWSELGRLRADMETGFKTQNGLIQGLGTRVRRLEA